MPRPPKVLNPYASWTALFGAALRHIRERMRPDSHVTQPELGKFLNFHHSTISAIERGTLRPTEKFVEICERELPTGGVLRALYPFVNEEWNEWERTGKRGSPAGILPPAELGVSEAQLRDSDFLKEAASGTTDAMTLARRAEASDIGGGTLETIDRKVDRYCRDYPTTSPAILEVRAKRQLRDVTRLLDGRLTLDQHRHLLVAGGWLSVLLACLQYDLGDGEAAERTRDAAFQLAHQADHAEITAWTHELLAWFALVEGRYQDTVEEARTGLLIAPNTSAGVQLAVQEARGLSRMGEQEEAEDALRRGATALARLPVPAHPEHHFVFDAAKLSFYAATCYTWLGEADRAREHANEVIDQCLSVPGVIRWPIRLAETRVDLGLIAEQHGQVDEAEHYGTQALAAQRMAGSTMGRVAELDAALRRDFPDAPETRDFHERYLAAQEALRRGAIS